MAKPLNAETKNFKQKTFYISPEMENELIEHCYKQRHIDSRLTHSDVIRDSIKWYLDNFKTPVNEGSENATDSN